MVTRSAPSDPDRDDSDCSGADEQGAARDPNPREGLLLEGTPVPAAQAGCRFWPPAEVGRWVVSMAQADCRASPLAELGRCRADMRGARPLAAHTASAARPAAT